MSDRPLRIAYLTYRGKPHVGGQGVYTRHLTKALVDLGHTVEVFGGQPYPVLDERIELHKLPSLDLWNDHYPGRFPAYWEFKRRERLRSRRPVLGRHVRRAAGVQRPRLRDRAAGGRLRPRPRQPVPRLRHPRHRADDPDDRHAAPPDHPRPGAGDGGTKTGASGARRKWYSFVGCRPRSPRQMPRIVVVSENSINDIHGDMGVSRDRMRLVPVGVDGAIPATAGRRPPTRPADHHRVRRRRPEGAGLPARGDGQAAHRARRRAPDDHRRPRAAPATT